MPVNVCVYNGKNNYASNVLLFGFFIVTCRKIFDDYIWHGNYLRLCFLSITIITITIIIIIIISNTIPPIAPAITGTAPEPVAVAVAVVTVLVMVVVVDGGVDTVVETSDECNEVLVDDTVVTVGGKVLYDDSSVLDTVTVLNNERY